MEQIGEITNKVIPDGNCQTELTYKIDQVDRLNNAIGTLTGYNCEKCKNRGYINIRQDGYIFTQECECMKVRRTLKLMRESGIIESLNKYNFENYKINEEWQQKMFDLANDFIVSKDNWFYLGGQVGCGKTHICTSIVGELLKKGIPVKYIIWNEEATKIKQNILEGKEYNALMEELKRIEVLYIDDLFKTQPTKADIDIAFKIINYRYLNNLKTIISCEKNIEQLCELDEAVASRIVEKAGKFYLYIQPDIEKNMRFKN
jgi:DNA replication protein DnaC